MRVFATFLVSILILCPEAWALDRKTFYENFDPSSSNLVFNEDGATATGNVTATSTYGDKTIEVVIDPLRSDAIEISVEGRSLDSPQFAVIETRDYDLAYSTRNITGNKISDVFRRPRLCRSCRSRSRSRGPRGWRSRA